MCGNEMEAGRIARDMRLRSDSRGTNRRKGRGDNE